MAVEVVARSLSGSAFADELIMEYLRDARLSDRDRGLVLEIVNGTLRWKIQLEFLLDLLIAKGLRSNALKLQGILLTGLYQLRFLDRIPPYACVSESVDIAKRLGGKGWGTFVNGVLRNYLRSAQSSPDQKYSDDPDLDLSIRYSHPQWLIKKWLVEFGPEATTRLCEFNNDRPPVSLRVVSGRISVSELEKRLTASGFHCEPSQYFDDFLRLTKSQGLVETPEYGQGFFAIQDESTALASLVLAPEPGDTVLDLCSAPGGKACHIAQLLGNKGEVVAGDISEKRLQRVLDNARRLQIKNISTVVLDATNVPTGTKYDKVIVDAPCSGLGVLSRRVDLRWNREPKQIDGLAVQQQRLLKQAAKCVKAGGTLVYSTCTMETRENEGVVTAFLEQHSDFELDLRPIPRFERFRTGDGFWKTLPFRDKIDGMFVARMVKATN